LLTNLAALAIERRRQEDNARWLDAFSNVFAASRAPRSAGDIDVLLREIAENVRRLSGADFVVLYEYFEEYGDIHLPPTLAGEVRTENVLRGRGVVIEHKRSAIFRLLKHQSPFFAEDAPRQWNAAGLLSKNSAAEDQSFFTREGVVSSAGIPLSIEDELIGVLFLNYRTPQTFPPGLRENLKMFANQAALAIGNARFSLRSQLYSQNLEALNRIGRELGSAVSRDILQIASLIDEQTRSVIPTRNLFFCLYDANTGRFDHPYLRDQYDSPEAIIPRLDEGLTAYVCRAGEPLFATREALERLFAEGKARLVGSPPAIWLGVPMLVRDKVIGALVVQDYDDETAFSEEHLHLLTAVASQAAIAIDNYRLLHNARLQLAETQENLHLSANAIAVGQITTTFVHEAKNALNGMSLTILNLMEDIAKETDLKSKDDYLEQLASVQSELKRFDDLSRRLQRFTQQGLRPEKKEAHLNEIVVHTLQLLGSALRKHRIRQETRLEQSLDATPIFVDEYQIQQVLMNLILNAIAASTVSGRLVIETRNHLDHVEARVTDFGQGIADEARQELFRPFFTTREDGVGLGLFLSRTLIEKNHQGRIEVFSNGPGNGATFSVCLPRQS